jgi:sugar/nucleoside kinase (ribokinase family)
MPRIIQQAKALGFKVSFDANSGDGWNHPQTLDVFRHEIFPFVDYLFLNRYEATSVTGQALPPSPPSPLSPCGRGAGGEGAMLDTLAEWNPDGILTIKLDAEGSCSRCDGRTIYVDGFPCAQIQDTVGAGDTFDATFVHYHQKGFSIDTAAVLANANARATLEKAGGPTGQCTQADLINLLGGYRIDHIQQSGNTVRYGIQVRD